MSACAWQLNWPKQASDRPAQFFRTNILDLISPLVNTAPLFLFHVFVMLAVYSIYPAHSVMPLTRTSCRIFCCSVCILVGLCIIIYFAKTIYHCSLSSLAVNSLSGLCGARDEHCVLHIASRTAVPSDQALIS
ncbi:hypothetical protein FA15DRAFT_295861 [Coprinopsis marcescibilis]|uniref:Uncharacterized protein n=1 Tax=Coprinopsis marcescibilis TaxID=230819 RepID=A0A5C3LDG1_COPMA|nr:hypothetical protein FA15DRAFT_295861 [Coprinopsis marcescibilis]